MWNKIESKNDLPDFKDVVYIHSCGSKGVGKLVFKDGDVLALGTNNKVKAGDGRFKIVAWLDIPEYR